jgi:hypothetical protein
MIESYKQYLDEIKKKLDSMNKASGFNPEQNQQIHQQNDHSMPSNEILDMLGAGAKMWMDKKRKEEEQNPEI